MKLLEDRSDVIHGGGSGNYASGRILDLLKLMEKFVRETKKKKVTVI